MISPDHKKYLIGNYASPAFEIVRGEGTKLWDAEGREFLDFTSGIAVTNLGHCHPHWTEQVAKQAEKIVHCSNLFPFPNKSVWPKGSCPKSGLERCSFATVERKRTKG